MGKPHQLSVLLKQFYDYLLIERQVSHYTLRNYQHYLTRFEKFCHQTGKSEMTVEQITQDLVRRYRVWLAGLTNAKGEPLQPATQAYHVIALRSFLRWLIKNDYQTLAPEKLDLPKQRGRRLEFLMAEQMERLLAAPNVNSVAGLRDRAILETLFSTGLRVSELVSLNRNQVNLKQREFGVKGKGGRVRVVFLSPRAVEWLEKYLATRDDEWPPLFINYRNPYAAAGDEDGIELSKFDPEYGEKRRLTSRSVQRMVRKYADQVQLPIEITPHGIRHSFATDLLMAGADLRSVQELLGHKNIVTTQIYTHVTNRQLKQVFEKYHTG